MRILTFTLLFGIVSLLCCLPPTVSGAKNNVRPALEFVEDEDSIVDVSPRESTLEEDEDESASLSTSTSTTTSTTTVKPKSRKKNPFLSQTRNQVVILPKSVQSSPMLNGSASSQDGTVQRKPIGKPTRKAPSTLKKIHDYLIVVLLVAVMFAMGCSITWAQVWSHVRRPVGVIIGMLSQFVLLPFAAYLLFTFFKLDPLHATGLLILACSPGGVTSNIFAYFLEGDLSLSVTMTSFSTVVALFMMPFNVWLYGRNLETEALVIPYGKMTVSLLSLTTPVLVGMFVNWKAPKIAPYLTQAGSVAGFAIIIVCQTLEVFIFPDIFNDVPLALYAAEFLLPLLGLGMGFGAASLFGLAHPVRRTIAIEAGIQNVGTALTIITLSFPFEQLRKVWLFPFLYAFSMLAVCCIIAVVYRGQKRLRGRKLSLDQSFDNDPKLRKFQASVQLQAEQKRASVLPQSYNVNQFI